MALRGEEERQADCLEQSVQVIYRLIFYVNIFHILI